MQGFNSRNDLVFTTKKSSDVISLTFNFASSNVSAITKQKLPSVLSWNLKTIIIKRIKPADINCSRIHTRPLPKCGRGIFKLPPEFIQHLAPELARNTGKPRVRVPNATDPPAISPGTHVKGQGTPLILGINLHNPALEHKIALTVRAIARPNSMYGAKGVAHHIILIKNFLCHRYLFLVNQYEYTPGHRSAAPSAHHLPTATLQPS